MIDLLSAISIGLKIGMLSMSMVPYAVLVVVRTMT
jgi:hypothetical protein